jgi:NADP-dependent 3-hydroxy acid dehydrogenase YdfG
MIKTALVTGATSGIGKATAQILAQNNYKIILCGRREDRLEEVKELAFRSSYVNL